MIPIHGFIVVKPRWKIGLVITVQIKIKDWCLLNISYFRLILLLFAIYFARLCHENGCENLKDIPYIVNCGLISTVHTKDYDILLGIYGTGATINTFEIELYPSKISATHT